MMRHWNRHRQGGFTLVELSVVLVIVGLLLGAVFAGQELIKNAQATRLKNQVKNIESMAQNFRDQRGRYPADCDNDGLIDIGIDSVEGASDRAARAEYLSTASNASLEDLEEDDLCAQNPSEYGSDRTVILSDDGADLFYNELKEAGLINETSVNRDVAEHTDDDYIFAGQLGISTGGDAVGGGGSVYNAIVVAGVSRFLARALDESIDGNADDASGGRVRLMAQNGSIAPAGEAWSSANSNSPDDKVHVAYFFEDVPAANEAE